MKTPLLTDGDSLASLVLNLSKEASKDIHKDSWKNEDEDAFVKTS